VVLGEKSLLGDLRAAELINIAQGKSSLWPDLGYLARHSRAE